ncbi:MAG: DNA-processing protein DprA [Gammaproteobacteria bacterium]|nr:DNA-processing protein DprA [Gammaproteobacteria bacterium]
MQEAAFWLALQRAPGLSARDVRRLLERFPEPSDLVAAVCEGAPALGIAADAIAYLRSSDWAAIEPELGWLEGRAHHLVTLADPRFPRLLRETSDPPLVLFVHGDPAVLGACQLAMVGSRHPTPGGVQTAFDFAEHLADTGLTITSGLAQGIDGASHRGALRGGGSTLAVVGTGLDLVYPARHRKLAEQIVERGAVVSEYPLGTPPRAGNFPQRNRIIAGLSVGTLVVEAAQNSGSLITARLAGEAGREVFAVPGSIHNPTARGCHSLIRQGAKLVERAQDILEELPALAGALQASPGTADTLPEAPAGPAGLDADYQRLLGCMGYDPVSVDTLVERSGLTAEAVSSMLLMLELRGCVSSLAGGLYTQVSRGS